MADLTTIFLGDARIYALVKPYTICNEMHDKFNIVILNA